MSTWSSFPKEKQYTDKWREFLEEGYKEEAKFCDTEDHYYDQGDPIEDYPVDRCGHPTNIRDQDIETYKHMVRGKSVDFEGPGTAPAPPAAPTPEPAPARAISRENRVHGEVTALVREMEAGRTSTVRKYIDRLSDDPELQTAIVKGLAERGYNLSAAPVPEPVGAETEDPDPELTEWAASNADHLKPSLEGELGLDNRIAAREWILGHSPEEQAAIVKALADIGHTFSAETAEDETPEQPEEAEEEEEAETTEISEEECAEIFKVDSPEIQDLLDQADADSTIRGKIGEIGRDLSMTADAATLALMAGAFATGGAMGIPAIVTDAISWGGSALAVMADVSQGDWKQAKLDAIGLIPLPGTGASGKLAATAARTSAKTAAKTAAKTTAKTTAKTAGEIAKATTKMQARVGGKVAQVEAGLTSKLVKTGIEEGTAKAIAKAMMISAEKALEAKMKKLLGGTPEKAEGMSDEDYKKTLKSYYDVQRAKTEEIFNTCFEGEEASRTRQFILDGLDEVHDFVDDIPRWVSSAVEWIGGFGDDDEEDAKAAIEDADIAGGADQGPGAGGLGESKTPKRPLIKEAQLKRWQQLAGINPRVL